MPYTLIPAEEARPLLIALGLFRVMVFDNDGLLIAKRIYDDTSTANCFARKTSRKQGVGFAYVVRRNGLKLYKLGLPVTISPMGSRDELNTLPDAYRAVELQP